MHNTAFDCGDSSTDVTAAGDASSRNDVISDCSGIDSNRRRRSDSRNTAIDATSASARRNYGTVTLGKLKDTETPESCNTESCDRRFVSSDDSSFETMTKYGLIESQNGDTSNASSCKENLTDEVVSESSADDSDEAEDDVHDNCLSRLVVDCRQGLHDVWTKHSSRLTLALYVTLTVAYLTYFSYAMHYRFGDEPSLRLLWLTCLVIVGLLLRRALKYCQRYNFLTSSQSAAFWSTYNSNQEVIRWILLAGVYTFVIMFIIVDVLTVSKNPYNLVSAVGFLVYIALLFVFSRRPDKVKWRTVLCGIALQFTLALVVLRWPAGYTAVSWIAENFSQFLAHTEVGTKFVFGDAFGNHSFALNALPVLIFFSSIVSILFHWGVMQDIIRSVASVMHVTMATTAPESLAAASNLLLLGLSEVPLVVRPMLSVMTKSELHAMMTCGFATIAGSLMAAFILLGVPANHLISASVMSVPAALVCSKLFYPETKKSKAAALEAENLSVGESENVLEAAADGASKAIPLVMSIIGNLIAYIAILDFVNSTLTWFGQRVGIDALTFQMLCSYGLWPLALIMGVDFTDCRKVAQLIGTKTVLNEFIAYTELAALINNRKLLTEHVTSNGTWHWSNNDIVLTWEGDPAVKAVLLNGVISKRSVVISTYALCGFSNFGSIAIQLATLGSLVPARRSDAASVALRAMIAGSVSCLLTACVAGLFVHE